MSSAVAVAGIWIGLIVCFYLRRRRLKLKTRWPQDDLQKTIAKQFGRHLVAQGIKCQLLNNDGVYDLIITGAQCGQLRGVIAIACRSRAFANGEILFRDMKNSLVISKSTWKPLLLVTFPLTPELRGLEAQYNIPVADVFSLHELVSLLKNSSEPLGSSKSPNTSILYRVLASNVFARRSLKDLQDEARDHEWRRDWEAAERTWSLYLDANYNMPIGHVGMALALCEQGKFDAAESVLYKVAHRFSDEPTIAVALAQCAQARGDWEAADARWRYVIANHPERWEGYKGRISALAASGRTEESEALLKCKAIEFQHEESAMHDLARLAERRGDWASAEVAWRLFIKINQRMSWAYSALARSLHEQGKFDDAEAVIRDALARFPADGAKAMSESRSDELSQ